VQPQRDHSPPPLVGDPERVLFVAWRSPERGAVHPVGRLVQRLSSPRFEFAYVNGVHEAHQSGFTPFISFPDLNRVYRSDSLFPLFQNRLIPESRPDYWDYLARLGLEPGADEPFAVIARGAVRGTTDRLEVFAPPAVDATSGTYTYFFFVRGVRHVPGSEVRIARLTRGDRLLCMLDVQNPFDRLAVALRTDDTVLIGYMPNSLREDLYELLAKGCELRVSVRKLNPSPTPVQHRILCQMEVRGVESFRPLSSERYQPLASDASPVNFGTVHPA